MFHAPNEYRITTGPFASSSLDGNEGAFEILRNQCLLICISSAMLRWQHVSCHKIITQQRRKARKIPTWNDMCFVKGLFWDEEDCVIQYHPPKSQYVNDNPFVLHLWLPVGIEIPLPPRELI